MRNNRIIIIITITIRIRMNNKIVSERLMNEVSNEKWLYGYE